MKSREQEIFFEDEMGVVHACRGQRIVECNPDTFLLWTLCERDVPANQGYMRAGEAVTCATCNEKAGGAA